MSLNSVTQNLASYPMEELAKIKARLIKKGVEVFDFGTGDPRIPTWPPIVEALKEAIPEVAQYPGIRGEEELQKAQAGYLKRRFGIDTKKQNLAIISSNGSKEAVFHSALSIVGRAGGRKLVIYPDPGYPVYRSSVLFAGGTPYPVRLDPQSQFLLEPWSLPQWVQKDAAAIWVNYPHNPTGALAPAEYWQQLVAWGQQTDTLILSDDCYIDIYDPETPDDHRPMNPLQFGTDGVISYMSLSKRSGLTGYRSGMIVGDSSLIDDFVRARANFGVATPNFIQAAAKVAWEDDDHVAERRVLFAERMAIVAPVLEELGLISERPRATFYLWFSIPSSYGRADHKFCLDLAQKGVIATPSRWLSEGLEGYARLALVPDSESTTKAMALFKEFVQEKQASAASPAKSTAEHPDEDCVAGSDSDAESGAPESQGSQRELTGNADAQGHV